MHLFRSEVHIPTRRLLLLVFSVLVALLGSQIAPSPWPAGPTRLVVTQDGEPIVDTAIELTASQVQVLASGKIEVGPRNHEQDQVEVFVDAGDADLGSLRVVLWLPDGHRELVPLVRRAADGRYLASRQPPKDPGIMLGLLGLVVILWVSEALPLYATSLLVPIVLVTAGTAKATAALAPFFHPIIALFLGAFVLAVAIQKVGLDRRVAVAVVHSLGHTPLQLYASLLMIAAVLSMWMSNTAAVAVLIPIAMAITEPLDDLPYRKTVVLGIAYAATIGGVGSAIGTPANPIAIAFLADHAGRNVSFAQWFGFGLPMVVLFLPIMGATLWWTQGVRVDARRFGEARRVAEAEQAEAGPLSIPQWKVLGVLALAIVGWLTEGWHGISTGIVALAAAVVLSAIGTVNTEDLRGISWESLLTFGGGLTLGSFLVQTGMSDWVATRLEVLTSVPSPVAIAVVAVIALALTTVASNTASAAVLVPLAIPLAAVLGLDPVVLVLVVAIASSVDFALVIGTPPTMLAYSTRLYTAGEIFRAGAVLDLIGIALLVTVVVFLWRLFGLV